MILILNTKVMNSISNLMVHIGSGVMQQLELFNNQFNQLLKQFQFNNKQLQQLNKLKLIIHNHTIIQIIAITHNQLAILHQNNHIQHQIQVAMEIFQQHYKQLYTVNLVVIFMQLTLIQVQQVNINSYKLLGMQLLQQVGEA